MRNDDVGTHLSPHHGTNPDQPHRSGDREQYRSAGAHAEIPLPQGQGLGQARRSQAVVVERDGTRTHGEVAVLVRAHLRGLTPLPKDELLALKCSIAELASIGRNINQVARTANEGGKAPGSVRDDLRAMLKIREALRDNTKALLKANEISWETGLAKADL